MLQILTKSPQDRFLSGATEDLSLLQWFWVFLVQRSFLPALLKKLSQQTSFTSKHICLKRTRSVRLCLSALTEDFYCSFFINRKFYVWHEECMRILKCTYKKKKVKIYLRNGGKIRTRIYAPTNWTTIRLKRARTYVGCDVGSFEGQAILTCVFLTRFLPNVCFVCFWTIYLSHSPDNLKCDHITPSTTLFISWPTQPYWVRKVPLLANYIIHALVAVKAELMLVVVAMADASTSFCYRPITMFFSGNGHKPVSFVVEGSSRRMWLLHKEFEKKVKKLRKRLPEEVWEIVRIIGS